MIRARTLRRLSPEETWKNSELLGKLKQRPFEVGTALRSVNTNKPATNTSNAEPPQVPLPVGSRLPEEEPVDQLGHPQLQADDIEIAENLDDSVMDDADDFAADDDGDADMDGNATSGTGASSSSSGMTSGTSTSCLLYTSPSPRD